MKTYKLMVVVLFSILSFAINAYSNDFQFGFGYVNSFNNSTLPNLSGYQAEFIYKAQERIAISISMGSTLPASNQKLYTQNASSEAYTYGFLKSNNYELLPGDFSMRWLEIVPIIYLFQDYSKHNISVYCSGGFGIYYAENKWDWNTYNSIQKSRDQHGIEYYEDDFDSKLGYNAQMGIAIPITQNSKINIEGKYLYYKPELSYEIQTPESYDAFNGSRKIDLSSFSYTISLMLNL